MLYALFDIVKAHATHEAPCVHGVHYTYKTIIKGTTPDIEAQPIMLRSLLTASSVFPPVAAMPMSV